MSTFPQGFLWGTATAAHQVEGNNTTSDWWHIEHIKPPVVAEPSGDACDSFHRYPEDIAIIKSLGLNAYRFSIEWARIEPEDNFFSQAMIDHYRAMIVETIKAGLEPVITLQHFTLPQWFRTSGGWQRSDAAEIFTRYVEKVIPILDGVKRVVTINEPNIYAGILAAQAGVQGKGFLPQPRPEDVQGLIAAHRAAVNILKLKTQLDVGWSVANLLLLPADPSAEEKARELSHIYDDQFIEVSRADDFIGVQSYSVTFTNSAGEIVLPEGYIPTDMGYAYLPDAVGRAIRYVNDKAPGLPIFVTENGCSSHDDVLRQEYLRGALEAVASCIAEGRDVRGYFHWSLLDNFEWAAGYKQKFGLVDCDRTTFVRTPKPSAYLYKELVQHYSR